MYKPDEKKYDTNAFFHSSQYETSICAVQCISNMCWEIHLTIVNLLCYLFNQALYISLIENI